MTTTIFSRCKSRDNNFALQVSQGAENVELILVLFRGWLITKELAKTVPTVFLSLHQPSVERKNLATRLVFRPCSKIFEGKLPHVSFSL